MAVHAHLGDRERLPLTDRTGRPAAMALRALDTAGCVRKDLVERETRMRSRPTVQEKDIAAVTRRHETATVHHPEGLTEESSQQSLDRNRIDRNRPDRNRIDRNSLGRGLLGTQVMLRILMADPQEASAAV